MDHKTIFPVPTIRVEQPMASLICAGIANAAELTFFGEHSPSTVFVEAIPSGKAGYKFATIEQRREYDLAVTLGIIPELRHLPADCIVGTVIAEPDPLAAFTLWGYGLDEKHVARLMNAQFFDEPFLPFRYISIGELALRSRAIRPFHHEACNALVLPVDSETFANPPKVLSLPFTDSLKALMTDRFGDLKCFNTIALLHDNKSKMYYYERDNSLSLTALDPIQEVFAFSNFRQADIKLSYVDFHLLRKV